MESKFKGTQGKWNLDLRDSRCCISQGDNKAICDVWGEGVSFIDNNEMKANAQLIATAPELLECLQDLENDNGSIPKAIWDKIQSTITKATTL